MKSNINKLISVLFFAFFCKLVQAIVLDNLLESGLHDLGSLGKKICVCLGSCLGRLEGHVRVMFRVMFRVMAT